MPRRARRTAVAPVPHPRSKPRNDRCPERAKRSDWQSESVKGWDWRAARFRLSDPIGGSEARGIQKPARTLYTARVGCTLSVSREVQRILLREEVLAMNRRNFLQSGSIVSVSLAFVKAGRLFSEVTTLDRWRTFQVTTRVEVLKTSGQTRVWVPAALTS